jgi:hypothetical protein
MLKYGPKMHELDSKIIVKLGVLAMRQHRLSNDTASLRSAGLDESGYRIGWAAPQHRKRHSKNIPEHCSDYQSL